MFAAALKTRTSNGTAIRTSNCGFIFAALNEDDTCRVEVGYQLNGNSNVRQE
jgi:hypothetical protein